MTSATLTVVSAPLTLNGRQYRAVATNTVGTATSSAATITVLTPPTMSLDRSSLRSAATRTGTAFTSQTLGQTVRLTQEGAGSVSWTATPTQPWISVSPSSGTGSATLTVTVQVVIDGVLGALPSGWTSRSDLTALFPAATYPGVTNALGVSTFDTTTLSNGVHTIAWVVTADNGQADGVGSRYFTVANASSQSSPVASRSTLKLARDLSPQGGNH